jgi:hypothetical protein
VRGRQARFIGRTVHVLLRASEVVVFHGRTEIARHPRLTTKGAERVVLDHFLVVATPRAHGGVGWRVVSRHRTGRCVRS